jgi:biotin operon repressor
MTLIELIPIGNENRITSAEISNRLGISGAEVRKQVNSLRCDGNPIASDSHGYYIATDATDLDHTIASFNSRISQMIKAREGLRNAQKKMNSEVVN